MRNIKLTIAYDGTDFHGWQRQPNLRTVQQALEDALHELTGKRANTNASGRTDAGVHALGQVVHFLTALCHSSDTFVRALNALLPRDVRVLAAEEKPQAFHATLDAASKRYRYAIDNGRVGDPFERRFTWHVPQPLDTEKMACGGTSSWDDTTSTASRLIGPIASAACAQSSISKSSDKARE